MTHFTRRSDWWLCNTFLLRCTNVHIHIYMTCSTHIELTLELLRIATQNNLKSADAVFQNTLCKSLYLIMHNKSPQWRYKFNDSVVHICQSNAIFKWLLFEFFYGIIIKICNKDCPKDIRIQGVSKCRKILNFWFTACVHCYIYHDLILKYIFLISRRQNVLYWLRKSTLKMHQNQIS